MIRLHLGYHFKGLNIWDKKLNLEKLFQENDSLDYLNTFDHEATTKVHGLIKEVLVDEDNRRVELMYKETFCHFYHFLSNTSLIW